MLPSFAYLRPASLREATEALTDATARAHAGGTDLLGCLRDGILPVSTVVSLAALDELRGMQETAEGGLRIGALTTLAEVAASEAVRAGHAALAEAAASVGSPQLRNQGTLGGNLCQKPRCWYYRGGFPCLRHGGEVCSAVTGRSQYHSVLGGEPCYMVHPSDTAAALLALDASVRVSGPGGPRVVPLWEFFVPPSRDVLRETVLGPGEVVVDVLLPRPGPGRRSAYRKVRARGSWDFAIAGVAVALRLEGRTVREARVALSGAAPVPWRATSAETALVGRPLDGAAARAAAAAAVKGAEPLRDNAYKVPLLQGLVEAQLLALAPA